ncbi:hypothetical protein L3V83_01105 [Thiotrichales bacterium 19X7-9]|nr:hypothetical protein [Thiotrichales bacterium 19X7-9]
MSTFNNKLDAKMLGELVHQHDGSKLSMQDLPKLWSENEARVNALSAGSLNRSSPNNLFANFNLGDDSPTHSNGNSF